MSRTDQRRGTNCHTVGEMTTLSDLSEAGGRARLFADWTARRLDDGVSPWTQMSLFHDDRTRLFPLPLGARHDRLTDSRHLGATPTIREHLSVRGSVYRLLAVCRQTVGQTTGRRN